MTVGEAARTHTAESNTPVCVSAARAAEALSLKRGEFDLAVHLGLIGAYQAPGTSRPRFRQREIERLRALPGFPDSLKDRVRTAGTSEGAKLLGVSPVRFTGLARVGCVTPVAFHLNRYRAVVWLYLVDELLTFASKEPDLIAGGSPVGMRTMLEAGTDWRARNWRSRRIDRLLSRAEDPWVRAALQASALDPVQLAEVVEDPYERAYLARVRPESAPGRPASESGREAMARLILADDPDEILWRRVNLTLEIDRAREIRVAPRPGYGPSLFRPSPTPPVPGRGVSDRSMPEGPVPGGPGAASGQVGRLARRSGRRRAPGRGLLDRIGLWRPGPRDH
ncbi:DUF6397 family protein [Streptomyces sp. HB132]|uniref:DUF6397 family protein n=1 Tax=Streptomyces sp. HB132 TaxID=767388 RepID=UPI0019615EC2|nr:DUF6397 family protein [Streptomyces sp. HB132]MBM7440341.1 hypothetical protein [Streptomyces sp. HB132]